MEEPRSRQVKKSLVPPHLDGLGIRDLQRAAALKCWRAYENYGVALYHSRQKPKAKPLLESIIQVAEGRLAELEPTLPSGYTPHEIRQSYSCVLRVLALFVQRYCRNQHLMSQFDLPRVAVLLAQAMKHAVEDERWRGQLTGGWSFLPYRAGELLALLAVHNYPIAEAALSDVLLDFVPEQPDKEAIEKHVGRDVLKRSLEVCSHLSAESEASTRKLVRLVALGSVETFPAVDAQCVVFAARALLRAPTHLHPADTEVFRNAAAHWESQRARSATKDGDGRCGVLYTVLKSLEYTTKLVKLLEA